MNTIKPGSVVVGVDGSHHSDAALAWAASYAVLTSRPLVVAHGAGALGMGGMLGGPLEAKELRRDHGTRVTEQAVGLASRMAPGVEIADLTVVADPREMLLSLSREAAIVVVGTRGHGTIASLLLGSVSLSLTSYAQCSVAVVRVRDVPAAGVAVGLACDGSDRSALEFAAGLAAVEGRALDAVHVWHAVDSLENALSPSERRTNKGRHERALSETLAGMGEKFPDVQVNRHLPEGRTVDALVKASQDADCLVLGSRSLPGEHRHLGSVARSVVEHAAVTVVVIRD